ncbi:hypothetical protein B0H12DRAFT_184175 [Mycena haematopus]|nr:hypothetical protein B0H12DRAFT_184175 [Mycena haematopus]
MFKKYKAFMNNEGAFEQPGARALQDYIKTLDQHVQMERAAQAVIAAQKRVREAEEAAREAEARAVVAQLEATPSRGSGSETQSLISRVSNETVTRERLFPETLPPPTNLVPPVRGLDGTTCCICFARCFVCPNPWQRTRSNLMVAEDDHPEPVPYGIVLKPCDHVFCGACLAQEIYHCLDMAFDSATYGTKLPSYARDALGPGHPEFPVSCPTCRTKGLKPREISDTTARLVLGESNMDEWNHARFLSTLRLLQCPHRGCNQTFDADDAIRLGSFHPHRETCVQCPHCRGPLCRTCRSVWHEDMTCLMYQALPRNEEPPEDGRKRHGWAPALHTQNPGHYSRGADSPESFYSQESMPSSGSTYSLHSHGGYSPGSSAYSPGSPYTPRESPRDQRAPPPWAHEKQSYLAYA